MHAQQYENQYYDILDDIFECNFNSFKLILFVIKLCRLWMNQNDPNRIFIEHDSGFTMINTRSFEPIGNETYVLSSQCELVIFC